MLRSLKEYSNEYPERERENSYIFTLTELLFSVPLEFNFRDILIKTCNQSAKVRQASWSSKLVNEVPFNEMYGINVNWHDLTLNLPITRNKGVSGCQNK